MLGLNIGILAVFLTTLLTLFLDTPFIMDFMRPDHLITSVELPNTEENQKASVSQDSVPVSSELSGEKKQKQNSEILEQKTRGNIYEIEETDNRMEYDRLIENAIDDESRKIIIIEDDEEGEFLKEDNKMSKEEDEEVIIIEDETVIINEEEKDNTKEAIDDEEVVSVAIKEKETPEEVNEEMQPEAVAVEEEDKTNETIKEEVISVVIKEKETPEEVNEEIQLLVVAVEEEGKTNETTKEEEIAPIVLFEDSGSKEAATPNITDDEEPETCLKEEIPSDEPHTNTLVENTEETIEEQETTETIITKLKRNFPCQKIFYGITVIIAAYSLIRRILSVLFNLISKFFPKSPWKKCPYYVEPSKAYTVSADNSSAVIKAEDGPLTTVIKDKPLPLDAPSSWSIKILKSKDNDCYAIYVGVAPYDIDLNNEDNIMTCGWYYNCFSSSLWSGPPHNCGWPKETYGPDKEDGRYHKEGSVIGVTMDPVKRELYFTLDGTSYGAAYTEMPVNKPLVPCVILGNKGDSVEFTLNPKNGSEKERNRHVDAPVDLNVEDFGWDSIVISWSPVPDVKFYQVDVDQSRDREISKTNSFRIRNGLYPGTDHTFRVRAVCSYGFSEWSETLHARTEDAPDFSFSKWNEMPPGLGRGRRYSLDQCDPHIATKTRGNRWSSVVGSAPLPPRSVVKWSINVRNNRDNAVQNNNEGGLYIGIVQSDADITIERPYQEGWYLYCFNSTLVSGPPHNYSHKNYGPRKNCGEYVRTGDSVGVIMDTTRGHLSFVMNKVDCGVAYEGIPLDKPLVPCVVLSYREDSVELIPVGIDEIVRYDKPPAPYVTEVRWNSLVVGWDSAYAEMHQIEVNNVKLQITGGGIMIIENLEPSTVYNIRVRYIIGTEVSEWSYFTTTKTEPMPFSECSWKECPGGVDDWKKYALSPQSSRIATCQNNNDWRTVISNIVIPQGMVMTWRVRIVRSRDNDGKSIYAGVAPHDIDQNGDSNITVSGWYLHCFNSTLWSGPPHKVKWKLYGQRVGEGNYVHTGDSVDVTMNMNRGELSFAVNETNCGIAFEGVPLDRPLVASAVMYYEGDSVELIFLNGKF